MLQCRWPAFFSWHINFVTSNILVRVIQEPKQSDSLFNASAEIFFGYNIQAPHMFEIVVCENLLSWAKLRRKNSGAARGYETHPLKSLVSELLIQIWELVANWTRFPPDCGKCLGINMHVRIQCLWYPGCSMWYEWQSWIGLVVPLNICCLFTIFVHLRYHELMISITLNEPIFYGLFPNFGMPLLAGYDIGKLVPNGSLVNRTGAEEIYL